MSKKRFPALLFLLVFLLISCSRTLPNETKTEIGETMPEIETETVTEEIPETSVVPPITEEIPVTTVHSHAFRVESIRQATCTSEGLRTWRCVCGESKEEPLPALTHRFSESSCTAPSVCSLCGLRQSTRLGHNLEGNVCTRCNKTFAAPINVLGKELLFDATRAQIEEALGVPTEVITEGGFVSLVYAENLAELTVIQTDDVGLWGVFTMDSNAFFLLEGKNISISNFSGAHDLNSDAYYQDIGTCRVFGFKDNYATKAFYGLWMRYSECRYDYMNDSAVASSYLGQARLSWYYTNALRAIHGLNALSWSDAAAKVATDYSKVMADTEILDHDGSFGERLKTEGVFWRYAGENISQGYFNLYFVCDAYYNSVDHRENILHEGYTHVGMGYYQTALQKNVFGAQIYFSY